MSDLRSPLAKARDEWFGTTEGERASKPGLLEDRFLRNRLEMAFCAGWDACAKSIKPHLEALENITK